jgi:hypothetical protein
LVKYPRWAEAHQDYLNKGLPSPVIPLHRDFRLLLLANRPGWPFLGNALGILMDVLSIHTVDAPDAASELSLLKSYAPTVDEATLRKLVAAFQTLRRAVEDGKINYPYSTRELVNVARHLQAFPADSIGHALANTVAFDRYDPRMFSILCDAFRR